MTRYQIRAIRRAAKCNARLLAGAPTARLSAWYALLDNARDELGITPHTPQDRRLIQAIERCADVILERAQMA
jgi:hypothetical protein